MNDNFTNISDISVSEINEQDLAQLDRDGYSFHPSKYQSNGKASATRNTSTQSDDIIQANLNSPTLNLAPSDLNRLELDMKSARLDDKSQNLFFPNSPLKTPGYGRGTVEKVDLQKGNGSSREKLRISNQFIHLRSPNDQSSTDENLHDENVQNNERFNRVLSPPLSQEKDLLFKAQKECTELKGKNQKLLEALNENNQLLEQLKKGQDVFSPSSSIASLRLEISKLTAKVANLEFENSQLKQSAESYPQSPLAEYSQKKALETRQQIERMIHLEYETKFIEYKEMCNNEYLQKLTKIQEDYETAISSLKSTHQGEFCKVAYQLDQLKNENTNYEKLVQTLRNDATQTVQRLTSENENRIAELTSLHQKSTNDLVERMTREQEEQISSIRIKYKQDLQSMSEKLKSQFNQMLQRIQNDSAKREQEQTRNFQHQQEEFKRQLAEKESIFVNSIIPFNENSTTYREMRQKIESLTKENSLLLQAKQKLIEKVRMKFREKVHYLKQTFQIQNERMRIECERKMSQRIDHLYTKYRLKLLELKATCSK